jgi:hypothetical protein
MLACFHPLTGRLLLALTLGSLLALVFIGVRSARAKIKATRRGHLARSATVGLGAFAALCGLALWLGSYSLSPLGFARQPALRGFIVQEGQGDPIRAEPGGGFSISRSSLAFIIPIIEPAGASCIWQSQAGAGIDAPDICDIAYAPPPGEYDVLRLRVTPGCGLPNSLGNLRIAILP